MREAIKKYKSQIPGSSSPSSFANVLKSTTPSNSEKSTPNPSKTTSSPDYPDPQPRTNTDISTAINNFSDIPTTSTPSNSYNASPFPQPSNINTPQTPSSNTEPNSPLTATNYNAHSSDPTNLNEILTRYSTSSPFPTTPSSVTSLIKGTANTSTVSLSPPTTQSKSTNIAKS